MKYLAYLLSVLFCVSVRAGGEDAQAPTQAEPAEITKSCEFKIECHKNQDSYAIEYKVLGDGCDDNAAGELILIADQKRTALQINGLPLKKVEDKGNVPKLCEIDGEKYPAFDIGDNRIALFFRIDNRPALDRLGGIIIDLNRRKVIKLEENFGEVKNQSFAMLKSSRGIKTRLAKDRLKDVDCDCDAALIDAWKEITPYSDIFKTKWIR